MFLQSFFCNLDRRLNERCGRLGLGGPSWDFNEGRKVLGRHGDVSKDPVSLRTSWPPPYNFVVRNFVLGLYATNARNL